MKECNRCQKEFKALTTAKYCLRCRKKVKKQQTLESYQRNKDNWNKRAKRWHFFNRESALKRMKRWRFKNPNYLQNWRANRKPKKPIFEPRVTKSYKDYLKESGYKEINLTMKDYRKILAWKPREQLVSVWNNRV